MKHLTGAWPRSAEPMERNMTLKHESKIDRLFRQADDSFEDFGANSCTANLA